jgi:hypothetical protein
VVGIRVETAIKESMPFENLLLDDSLFLFVLGLFDLSGMVIGGLSEEVYLLILELISFIL